MNGLEKITYKNKVVALIIGNKVKLNDGINFFTKPNEPLQLALHSYKSKKETSIHSNKVLKPIVQKKKYKYLYILKGRAKLEFFVKPEKIISTQELVKGDSVLIMDILHKVTFAVNSQAIEIKQGPYEEKA